VFSRHKSAVTDICIPYEAALSVEVYELEMWFSYQKLSSVLHDATFGTTKRFGRTFSPLGITELVDF
jgi:hypothetical protein